MQQRALLFAVRLGTRLIVACLAVVLTVSMTERAFAVNCLAYKPDRAQGEWHADVVSGKICWYGPNWRSFLPKPKARVENSQVTVTNSKPKMKVLNRKPDTVKTEAQNTKLDAQIGNSKSDTQVLNVEDSKPDLEIDISKPDTQVLNVENSKPNVLIENSKPDMPGAPASPVAEAVDSDMAQNAPGVRKATPVKAAEFTNAASLEFDPEPEISNLRLPTMKSEPQSITDLLIAFSVVALGTVGLVALIMRRRSLHDIFDTDIGEEPLEHIVVTDELAPPLEPNTDDEHFALEEPEHSFT